MVRSWSTSFGTSGRSTDEGLECTWTSWAIWEGSKGTVTAVSASGLRIHSGSVNNTFHFANKDEKGSLGNMIQKSDTHGSVCFRRNRHTNNTCFSGLEHSFQGMSSKEKTPYICKAMCRNKKSILKNWKLNEEMYRMYDEVGVSSQPEVLDCHGWHRIVWWYQRHNSMRLRQGARVMASKQ